MNWIKRLTNQIVIKRENAIYSLLIILLFIFQDGYAETPGQEAARVRRQLEEQRFQSVDPPQITINQYRYQMELENRLRSQQKLIDSMEKQVEQLRRSNRYDQEE